MSSTTDKLTIYAAMIASGVQIDHHESDMYVPVNDITREILQHYPELKATTFTSEGEPWFDIPFAYLPWWEERLPKAERIWLYRVRGALGLATHAHIGGYVEVDGYEFLWGGSPRDMTCAQLHDLKPLPIPR